MPTTVCRNITSCCCNIQRITLIYKFTFKERRGSDICCCRTTERFGQNRLTTSTCITKRKCITQFCVCCSNRKFQLIIFKRVCGSSNSIVSCSSIQTTSCTRRKWELCTITSISYRNSNFSTIGNTVGEGELKQTQVKVNNIVERRLQIYTRCRRISSTRIFDQNLIQTTILDCCFSNSTRTATTRDNNSRCLRITRTRIINSNTGKNTSRC